MLYTKKGDNGTTTTFGCNQRMSKSSAIAEALGTLDEANSYLGMCKIQARTESARFEDGELADIIHEIQNDLFVIQAELAGAEKTIIKERVERLEQLTDDIEKELPEIHSFFIAGGCELSSRFDFARTLIRKAERRVVGVHSEGVQKVGAHTLAYLNRLSSILYALARFANKEDNKEEKSPSY